MKKIESAPASKRATTGDILRILTDNTFQEHLKEANEKYLYWDRVKYMDIPKVTKHETFWKALKLLRRNWQHNLDFGNYHFTFKLTNAIQKELHFFDLNIGGLLGSGGLVPEEDKSNYLISSIMEEAIASSQIEGAVTTRRAAKEMLRKNRSPKNKSEQMIINNYQTIKHILEIKNEKLTPGRILEIHKMISNKTLDDISDEGRFRDNNEVNVIDSVDGEIVYMPPSHEEIETLIKKFCVFFNKDDERQFIHPIIKACIIHFMIGFIHPFVDGNGRTARTLFYWYLLSKGYWLTEYLSISRMIVRTKNQYAMAYLYTETDENDLTYFINYSLRTMHLAFNDLRDYIARKIKEKKQLTSFLKIPGINSRQAQILKWIEVEPEILLTAKEIETRFGIANQTSRNDLSSLTEQGFLKIIMLDGKTQSFTKGDKFDVLISSFSKR